MAYDFPSSPTDGQTIGVYKWSAALGVWVRQSIPDPPKPIGGQSQVDVEYSRVSGAWRLHLERKNVAGVSGPAPITLVGAARIVRLTGVLNLTGTGGQSGATETQVSLDGNSFITQGGNPYAFMGPYHSSSTAGAAFLSVGANAAAPCLYLTPGVNNSGVPHLVNAMFTTFRPSVGEFMVCTNSFVYNSTNSDTQHGEWRCKLSAAAAGAYLTIHSLRTTWGAQVPTAPSYLTAEFDYA